MQREGNNDSATAESSGYQFEVKESVSIVSCKGRLQWKSTLNKINVSSMKVSEYKEILQGRGCLI